MDGGLPDDDPTADAVPPASGHATTNGGSASDQSVPADIDTDANKEQLDAAGQNRRRALELQNAARAAAGLPPLGELPPAALAALSMPSGAVQPGPPPPAAPSAVIPSAAAVAMAMAVAVVMEAAPVPAAAPAVQDAAVITAPRPVEPSASNASSPLAVSESRQPQDMPSADEPVHLAENVKQQQQQQRSTPSSLGGGDEAEAKEEDIDQEHEAWAQSLVGREWEIFWDEDSARNEGVSAAADDAKDDAKDDEKPTQEGNEGRLNNDDEMQKSEVASKGDAKEDEKDDPDSDSDEDDEEDEEDETDWYDAQIVSYDRPIFGVKFVGDERNYTMKLGKGIVRPSVRAWMNRSIAMLNWHGDPDGDGGMLVAQKGIPCNTATPEDEQHFAKAFASLDGIDTKPGTALRLLPAVEGTASPARPVLSDRLRIRALQKLVKEQIYLRSRLATIVASHYEDDEDDDDEPKPTESYVNFLVNCLELLDGACGWYIGNAWSAWVMVLDSDSDGGVPKGGVKSSTHNTADSSGVAASMPVAPPSVPFGAMHRIVGQQMLEQNQHLLPAAQAQAQALSGSIPPVDSKDGAGAIPLKAPIACGSVKQDIKGDVGKKVEMASLGKCIVRGVHELSSLVSMSTSAEAAKKAEKKRGGSQPTRRGKRKRARKVDATGAGIDREAESGLSIGEETRKLDENNTGTVDLVVPVPPTSPLLSKCTSSKRWYVRIISRMLSSLVNEVFDPIMRWIRRADSLLGKESFPEDAENDEENSGSQVYCTVEDVMSCLAELNCNRLLQRIKLQPWASSLYLKLEKIAQFESEAWCVIRHCADDPGDVISCSDSADNAGGEAVGRDDAFLRRLREIKDAAESSNPHLLNVNPLGQSTSLLTRAVIDNAITIRLWILDLRRAERCRERVAFLQSVISRAHALPQLPLIPTGQGGSNTGISPNVALEQFKMRVPGLSTQAYSWGVVISDYDQKIVSSTNPLDQAHAFLRTLAGVVQSLRGLSQMPALSLCEEKIAVRANLLEWNDQFVSALMANTGDGPSLEQVDNAHEALTKILKGQGPARASIVSGLKQNDAIDIDVCTFAERDAVALCSHVPVVRELHRKGMEWKSKADSILITLRGYGNSTFRSDNEESASVKGNIMIDLKRVDDLVNEHNSLGVSIGDRYDALCRVKTDADKWRGRVEQAIRDKTTSAEGCLSRLTALRDNRPKGIMMEPARHIFDVWIDALDWVMRAIEGLKQVLSIASKITLFDGGDSSDSLGSLRTEFSNSIEKNMCAILIEGHEILDVSQYPLSRRNGKLSTSIGMVVDLKQTVFSKLESVNVSAKPIPMEKLSGGWGKTILERIHDESMDSKLGSPIFFCRFLQWHLAVVEFIAQSNQGKSFFQVGDDNYHPSLQDAKSLCWHGYLENTVEASEFAIIIEAVKKVEVKVLLLLIKDAEEAEFEASELISGCGAAIRDAFNNGEIVRGYLARLKDVNSTIKSRCSVGSGLRLSLGIEDAIDKKVKDFSWMVKSFSHPILYGDHFVAPSPSQSESKSSAIEGEAPAGTVNENQASTIPWDALVGIYEKSPLSFDAGGNASREGLDADMIRVCLRVRELYLAASEWQEEVARLVPLSARGFKRRGRRNGSSGQGIYEKSFAEPERVSRVNVGQLEKIARNEILSKVNMPRQEAVRDVLDRAKRMQVLMGNLLENDNEGHEVDRAPFPEATSLISSSGQFLIYRLTENPLYGALRESISSISEFTEELLVDTPEKLAFEWVADAVSWVEELREAVKKSGSFVQRCGGKLIITCKDAQKILADGYSLFLGVSEDVRKTLSKHKVYLSTNKQTEKLSVVVGKGGANHSMGGTVLRWTVLLFDCLKGDIALHEEWKKRAADVIAASSELDKGGDENIDHVLSIQAKVNSAINEARDTLFIAPEEEMYLPLRKLKDAVDNEAERNLSLKRKREKERYEDPTSLVQDRFRVLDSLLSGKRQRKEGAGQQFLDDESNASSIRDKSRLFLEKSLAKGMQIMGIDVRVEKRAASFCSFKAWVLEDAIFSKYPTMAEGSGGKSSPEYRAKVRTLKHNLEDIKNPTLCSRVLLGTITASELVGMSPEDLASKKLKQNRAKAEEEARRNVVLTPLEDSKSKGAEETAKSGTNIVKGNTISVKGIGSGSPLKGQSRGNVSQNATASSSVINVKALLKKTSGEKTNVQMKALGNELFVSPPTQKAIVTAEDGLTRGTAAGTIPSPVATKSPTGGVGATSPLASRSTISVAELLQKTKPPPFNDNSLEGPEALSEEIPPQRSFSPTIEIDDRGESLVASPPPQLQPQQQPLQAKPEPFVLSVSGGGRFRITVSALAKLSFETSFIVDGSKRYSLDAFLPEALRDKGRLSVDEFNRFVSDKTDSGRWTAIILRLVSIVTEEDMSAYKIFYKEYEAKNRIAMFPVLGKEAKMFLVTPKFLNVARCLKGKISSRTSTYAVVLTKEKLSRYNKE